MTLGTIDPRPAGADFSHEALLYRGPEGFAEAVSSFVREGVEAGEAVLVVVSEPKISALRERLGPEVAGAVCFSDMAEIGRNPARIIPAWEEFVEKHAGEGKRFRGVGEPIGPHLGPEKLVECQLHEALLNVAFAASPGPGWRLVCPYDRDALPQAVIDQAFRSHPIITEAGRTFPSPSYADPETLVADLEDRLREPPPGPVELAFSDVSQLSVLRRAVAEHATAAGVTPGRVEDLVLAVNELATNSLRHGGGAGALRMWTEGGDFVCEVRDQGYFRRPLIGRQRPQGGLDGGRGFWLVNQLCDLVQIRSVPSGTAVRVHMTLS
ncbi:MAG: sensor histidine kinase [Actinomycetota bacterium]|nr:sensor histidine kinase [Actinomycetota bacterium]